MPARAPNPRLLPGSAPLACPAPYSIRDGSGLRAAPIRRGAASWWWLQARGRVPTPGTVQAGGLIRDQAGDSAHARAPVALRTCAPSPNPSSTGTRRHRRRPRPVQRAAQTTMPARPRSARPLGSFHDTHARGGHAVGATPAATASSPKALTNLRKLRQ